MARRVALLGATLIVAGLLVAGVQTGGFDQVDADRGVSVEVAPQNASYLAFEESYSGDQVGDCVLFCLIPVDQPQDVLTLENRYVEDYATVQIEIANVDGANVGTFQITDQPSSLTVDEGDNVEIGCADDGGGQGEASITFETTVTTTNQNASIAGTTTVDGVQYYCGP